MNHIKVNFAANFPVFLTKLATATAVAELELHRNQEKWKILNTATILSRGKH